MSDYLDKLSDNYQTRVHSVMSISQTTYSVIEIVETSFSPVAKEVAASTTMPLPFKQLVSFVPIQVLRSIQRSQMAKRIFFGKCIKVFASST